MRCVEQRRASEKWVAEWTQTAPTGRFASANRLTPQTKPRQYFFDLPREVYGRVLQCRTGHGFIGEYYSQFVPSESVDCPCGAPYQTRRHLLQACPRYDEHRHILQAVSDTIDIPTILGTAEGIAALACFLVKSGALTKTGERRTQGTTRSAEDDQPDAEDGADEDEDGVNEDDGEEAGSGGEAAGQTDDG